MHIYSFINICEYIYKNPMDRSMRLLMTGTEFMEPVLAGKAQARNEEILGRECLQFAGELSAVFSPRRNELLLARTKRQKEFDSGMLPAFREDTKHIRNGKWKISAFPSFLDDRRVEITGPSGDAKMVINAFNSGAKVYMSDFEDAQSPTWDGIVSGQDNLYDAVRGDLRYRSDDGKNYELGGKRAVLFVRPRGLHMEEKHVLAGGVPMPASFFDYAVFIFNNGRELVSRGYAPCFYIPKIESMEEARLWNDIFSFSESYLGLKRGSVKATFLIETILAAFEMDEILYETREHSAGLNCGRWDYIFSYIKKFRNHPQFVLPDRSSVTMDKGFLLAYSKLLIGTCHRRGAHAMGGMSAYIPVKGDPSANERAFRMVRDDKIREVLQGHDGTWVAHPGLVPVAMEVFDQHMKTPNQVMVPLNTDSITPADLLKPVEGSITEDGIRVNVRVGVRYIDSWLSGRGAAPIYNLMEDAATAEICRSQIWQWLKNRVALNDGRLVTPEFVENILESEKVSLPATENSLKAFNIFKKLTFDSQFEDFLTSGAYDMLVAGGA